MSKAFIELLHSKQNTGYNYADKESAEDFINKLFKFLFHVNKSRNSNVSDLTKEFQSLQSYLATLIYSSTGNGDISQETTEHFFDVLPSIFDILLKDAGTIATEDPAALSVEEVEIAYPGFFAIAVYRLAHVLYERNIKQLARLFTEYAHKQTGIDIHPGASIGTHFFIDHGTGIVIGETSVIGSHVKIYQGVTIGAFSGKHELSVGKRHPTIEDGVIIYANATILGGRTTIGKGSIIGANVWITESIPSAAFVYQKNEVIPAELQFTINNKTTTTV